MKGGSGIGGIFFRAPDPKALGALGVLEVRDG